MDILMQIYKVSKVHSIIWKEEEEIKKKKKLSNQKLSLDYFGYIKTRLIN